MTAVLALALALAAGPALATATPLCSPATQAAAGRADVAGLPARACLMHAPTGDFVCDRKHGCNRCDIDGSPCPKVKP